MSVGIYEELRRIADALERVAAVAERPRIVIAPQGSVASAQDALIGKDALNGLFERMALMVAEAQDTPERGEAAP